MRRKVRRIPSVKESHSQTRPPSVIPKALPSLLALLLDSSGESAVNSDKHSDHCLIRDMTGGLRFPWAPIASNLAHSVIV